MLEAARGAAEALFDPGKKIDEATAALNTVIANAGDAAKAASERRTATTVRKAIEAARPGALPATVAAALGAADTKLKAGRFAAAHAGYLVVRKSMAAIAETISEGLEAADGGHGVKAHGPQTASRTGPGPDDPQVIRVKTGTRPGTPPGKVPKTLTATNFENLEDWLSARQLALDKVLAGYGINPPPAGKKIQVIIEHDKPIDRCIAGLRAKSRLGKAGLEEGDTCTTYEVWTGLTHTHAVQLHLQRREMGAGAAVPSPG